MISFDMKLPKIFDIMKIARKNLGQKGTKNRKKISHMRGDL